jgi:hypothetical protein
MTGWSDLHGEMTRLPLDVDTADRLLAGRVLPQDAPPGYGELARSLAAVSESHVADAFGREAKTVLAMAAVVRSSRSTTPQRSRRLNVPRVKLAGALAALTIGTTAGLAFAGGLPGAAQDIVSTIFAKVGVSVPGPNENAGDHPNVRGESTDVTLPASGKGAEISGLATTTDLTGVEKGAAISAAASDGKSRAGQQGAGTAGSAPVATPNTGGTGTADTASAGHSGEGTSEADDASGGRSGAGSANSAAGQSNRP